MIENEFGEVGIDDALVLDAEEEIFEMNNGCICCTVRGDLIRILGALMRRRDRFDQILIETTGLADPAPVAQTFFVDDEIRDRLRLDAIVTMADAAHVLEHLDEVKPDDVENEAVEQVAFADRMILNKVDLVDEPKLTAVESRLRSINSAAEIVRSQDAKVDLDRILDVGAFDLQRVLTDDPAFLEQTDHQHDQTVTSVGFQIDGDIDVDKLNDWLGELLGYRGATSSAARASSHWKTSPASMSSRVCTCSSTAPKAGNGGRTSRGPIGWCSSAATSTAPNSKLSSGVVW